MRASDAATSSLEATTDAARLGADAADELFAVVDLLDGNAPLRRSLTEPSASPEDRAQLAQKLFGKHLSPAALGVVQDAVRLGWPSGRSLASGLERLGVRALLRIAQQDGELDQVSGELHSFATTVEQDHALSDALRNRTYPLASRRALVAELVAGKVNPVTGRLLSRAAAARVRSLPLTVATYLEAAARLADERIARVTVARPLDAARTDRLRRALEARAGGPVALQITVDPRVLGGMDVQLGDNIIESTMAGRLDDARRLLKTT